MAFVEFEAKGQIGVLTINRPEALNALNDQVISQLDTVLDSIDLNTIRCVIVTGAGKKAFVAGADIAQMSGLTKAEGEAFGKLGNDVFRKLETLPVPTIAAVNGFALGGGCELCMSCDIRLASDTAVFTSANSSMVGSNLARRAATTVLAKLSFSEILSNSNLISVFFIIMFLSFPDILV